MKIKFISFLVAGMMVVSAAMLVTPPMVSSAASQDEPKEYLEYINSLVDQGYSEEEIYKYVDTHTDGALSDAMEDLPEAIENGDLVKDDNAELSSKEIMKCALLACAACMGVIAYWTIRNEW